VVCPDVVDAQRGLTVSPGRLGQRDCRVPGPRIGNARQMWCLSAHYRAANSAMASPHPMTNVCRDGDLCGQKKGRIGTKPQEIRYSRHFIDVADRTQTGVPFAVDEMSAIGFRVITIPVPLKCPL
jgi:hypothetical protein